MHIESMTTGVCERASQTKGIIDRSHLACLIFAQPAGVRGCADGCRSARADSQEWGSETMSASIHDKLNRVRKPRVHITYEVETEGAEILRELPFVVGVMGDFSGDPTQPLRPLADRKFIQIDRDNFNDVMAAMTPGPEAQGRQQAHRGRRRDGGRSQVQLDRGLRAGARRRSRCRRCARCWRPAPSCAT